MLTLAIVSSTPQVGVAVGDAGEVLASLVVRRGQRHAESLAPAIESCTRLAGVGLQDVERVAVDIGPGLFTGLRVGVATAKALASALGVEIVARSSLELLAHPHRDDGRVVASVVDARRGEVFWALYHPAEGGMIATTAPEVMGPEDLALALALAARGEAIVLTGDGARRYAGVLDRFALAPPEFDHPTPEALLRLSRTATALDLAQVTPAYIRGADVRIGWEQRDG